MPSNAVGLDKRKSTRVYRLNSATSGSGIADQERSADVGIREITATAARDQDLPARWSSGRIPARCGRAGPLALHT